MSRVESIATFFGERRTDPVPAVPARPDLTAEQSALIAEACSKSGVVWVRPLDDARRHLAWQVWHEDAVHVVYQLGEQPLPLLAGHVEVCVPSKEDRSTLVVFVAAAQVLAPMSPAWEAAVTALAAARLNAADPAGQRERWASGSLVSRLEPVHVLAAGPGDQTTAREASAVLPSAGNTLGRRPWHLGGRRRRG